MKELNLKKKVKPTPHRYGIKLSQYQKVKVEILLERIRDLSPSSSITTLRYDRNGEDLKGCLTVKSFGIKFQSQKTGQDPVEIMMLLKDDVEDQLLDWKRNRFSHSLFQKISAKALEGCA